MYTLEFLENTGQFDKWGTLQSGTVAKVNVPANTDKLRVFQIAENWIADYNGVQVWCNLYIDGKLVESNFATN